MFNSDTCKCTIWRSNSNEMSFFFSPTETTKLQSINMANEKKKDVSNTWTQFCWSACSSVAEPHWTGLFMATDLNKALQSPWFVISWTDQSWSGHGEVTYRVITDIRQLWWWQCCHELNQKVAAQLWPESHGGQGKVHGAPSYSYDLTALTLNTKCSLNSVQNILQIFKLIWAV